jgi:hypothetical protein
MAKRIDLRLGIADRIGIRIGTIGEYPTDLQAGS